MCISFTEKFHEILNSNLKVKKLVKKQAVEEWITEDILKAMKYRDCLKSRLDSNKNRGINDLYLKQQYNKCRNITISSIRKTKKELIYEKIRSCRGKSKDI